MYNVCITYIYMYVHNIVIHKNFNYNITLHLYCGCLSQRTEDVLCLHKNPFAKVVILFIISAN